MSFIASAEFSKSRFRLRTTCYDKEPFVVQILYSQPKKIQTNTSCSKFTHLPIHTFIILVFAMVRFFGAITAPAFKPVSRKLWTGITSLPPLKTHQFPKASPFITNPIQPPKGETEPLPIGKRLLSHAGEPYTIESIQYTTTSSFTPTIIS
jgi:hypothetical protein